MDPAVGAKPADDSSAQSGKIAPLAPDFRFAYPATGNACAIADAKLRFQTAIAPFLATSGVALDHRIGRQRNTIP